MRRPLARAAVAILLSAILIVAAVLPAAADYSGPVYRGPSPDSSGLDPWLCPDFPVQFTIVKITKWQIIWQKPDGTWVVRYPGGGVFTWANALTGTTITTQLHGDITEVYPPEGGATVTWTGNHVVPPLAIVAQGRTVTVWESEGVMLSSSTTGHFESLCEALSG